MTGSPSLGSPVPRAIRIALSVVVSGSLLAPFLLLRAFPSRDFGSHVYNAWLARRVASEDFPGLFLQWNYSNALFDLLLSGLVAAFGPRWAEAAGLVVLSQAVLWSSFWCIRRVVGRPPWDWLPVLAALSVGWTFHMGFANYLLSLSLSLAAVGSLSLDWERDRKHRVGLGFLALSLALLAHPVPVAWALAAILGLRVASRFGGRCSPQILIALPAAILAVGFLARWVLRAPWDARGLLFVTGADQLAVFDAKYRVFSVLFLVSCAFAARATVRAHGFSRAMAQPIVVLAVATAAFVFSLPRSLALPGSESALGILVQRSSLIAGVCLVGVASLTTFSVPRLVCNTIFAAAWFATIAVDWHAYSSFLGGLETAVARLPADARVMATPSQPASRIDWLTHAVDQACVGHCISFANYEPSTNVFRVRARPGNEFVLSSAADLYMAESGQFVAPERPTLHALRFVGGEAIPFVQRPGTVVARQCVDLLWQVPGFRYDRCRFGRPSRY